MKDKDQKFMSYWQNKRQHKWRYIFKVGVFGWGLPVGLIAYFLMIVVGSRDYELPALIIQVLVFGGGGMAYGYSQFRATDNRYLRLLQSNSRKFHEKS